MFNSLQDIPILLGFVPPASPWNGPLVPGFVGMGKTPQSCHKSIKIPLQLQFISVERVFNRKYSPKFQHQMDQLQWRISKYLGIMLVHEPREVLPSQFHQSLVPSTHNKGMQDRGWGSLEFMGCWEQHLGISISHGTTNEPRNPSSQGSFGQNMELLRLEKCSKVTESNL